MTNKISKTPYEIILKKQKGHSLSFNEIKLMVDGYTDGSIPDYQITAWLMSVFFTGMNEKEITDYTKVMLSSGIKLDFSHLSGFVVDKHSTGGVGDKVSLILGPLLAAYGYFVPMLSGRALGHTGGTLDKLESIPGYRTTLPIEEFSKIVESVGISIMGQTDDICPADGKIYALRDVTSTISSLPLICGSIMSKKISEGIQGLILDVKWGNGAFMKSVERAAELAELLQSVGELYGIKTAYSITDMNQPLGRNVGIWCEVEEAIEALKGNAPTDLMEITYHLAEQVMTLAGETGNYRNKLESLIQDGSAFEIFNKMVYAHGGYLQNIQKNPPHLPRHKVEIISEFDGFISEMDTEILGLSIITLGGGRQKKDDMVDNSVGYILDCKVGDQININERIATVFGNDRSKLLIGKKMIENAITISEDQPNVPKLIVQSH